MFPVIFLLLLFSDYLKSEELYLGNTRNDKPFKSRAEPGKKDLIVSNRQTEEFKAGNDGKYDASFLDSCKRMKSFQILDENDKKIVQNTISFYEIGLGTKKDNSRKSDLGRLTYKSVLFLERSQVRGLFQKQKNYLPIGERLLVQGSQITLQKNGPRKVNKLHLSKSFPSGLDKGGLQDAVKESMINTAKKSIDIQSKIVPGKSPSEAIKENKDLNQELKEIKIMKNKSNIEQGNVDLVREIITLINNENIERKQSEKTISKTIDINIPIPPDTRNTDQAEEMDDPFSNIEAQESGEIKLPRLNIPRVEQYKGPELEKSTVKKKRNLPPGAEQELREFLERKRDGKIPKYGTVRTQFIPVKSNANQGQEQVQDTLIQLFEPLGVKKNQEVVTGHSMQTTDTSSSYSQGGNSSTN
ncbi:hypothetical protein HWI79_175 [Cryptosporidium felis]|nr:hypothetical protein HWI79_175 [Cryptosporidium felis]